MMVVDSRKGGHALNLQILFHVLKIICLLLIVGTWIWLLIYFFPVIRTILHIIFFPPKLSPVDPADIPPEGSLSLSVFPCRNHPILSDRRASAYVAYVLERNWVDEQLPDLTTLGDAIIAEALRWSRVFRHYANPATSCSFLSPMVFKRTYRNLLLISVSVYTATLTIISRFSATVIPLSPLP